MQRKCRYGWIPDLPDHRDHLFAAPPAVLRSLPRVVDLRRGCPPVYDQGELGSCTANAIAGAIQFEQLKQKLAQSFTPSRLFIYFNERAIEGTVDSDSGRRFATASRASPRRALRRRPIGPTTSPSSRSNRRRKPMPMPRATKC